MLFELGKAENIQHVKLTKWLRKLFYEAAPNVDFTVFHTIEKITQNIHLAVAFWYRFSVR